MNWATERRLTIFFILGVMAVAVVAVLWITVFYQIPSCTDGKQNQDEAGVDCGDSCTYLCTEQERSPIVLFTKALPNINGRIDLIASVANMNTTAAARAVSYSATLYGADHMVIGESSGTVELPPGATVPVYIPNIVSVNQKVAQAFLTIATSSVRWYSMSRDSRVMPIVSNTVLSNAPAGPHIDATLSNPTVIPMGDVPVIVTISDPSGNVIGASRTLVPVVPPQGTAIATFTWNIPFEGIPSTIEVVPIIPLPMPVTSL